MLGAAMVQAAGFQTLEIANPAGKPISVAVWYPSADAVQPRKLGTFSQSVASDGAIQGKALPLVLISHGNGGYQYSHHDTALALADAGYIVAAPTHPGDNYADQSAALDILARPRHMSATLDYLLGKWQHREHIAPSRIGIFGFSSGGLTALVSIGAQPDLKKVFSHCAAHPKQFACTLVAAHGEQARHAASTATAGLHDTRFRAAVIAAPALGFTFDAAALRSVTIPVQLWRAEEDEILPHPWYAEQVHLGLAREHDYRVVPGAGHFDFLAPCTAQLAAIAPAICTSQAGFDRSVFHRKFNADLLAWFNKTL